MLYVFWKISFEFLCFGKVDVVVIRDSVIVRVVGDREFYIVKEWLTWLMSMRLFFLGVSRFVW